MGTGEAHAGEAAVWLVTSAARIETWQGTPPCPNVLTSSFFLCGWNLKATESCHLHLRWSFPFFHPPRWFFVVVTLNQ